MFSTWHVCKWASPVKTCVHACRTHFTCIPHAFHMRAFVKLPLSRTVCTYISGSHINSLHRWSTYMQSHKNEYADSVMACLVSRVKLQHTELLSDTLAMLVKGGKRRKMLTMLGQLFLISLTVLKYLFREQVCIWLSLKKNGRTLQIMGRRTFNLVQEDYRYIW